jgi:uncharacterized protein (DUF1919 family)
MKKLFFQLRYNYFLFKRKIDRRTLKNKDFTLFANDCWGGELYKYFDLEYNTPFIGLYVMAPCYLKFLKNPDYYLNLELSFTKESKYDEVELTRSNHPIKFPVGILGDIEIQFMHYKTEEEAALKWNRRKMRINRDNLFVKFDGSKDAATDSLIKDFDNLPYRKICIVNKSFPKIPSALKIPNWESDGAKMFLKTMKVFNIKNWLNNIKK